MKTKAEAMKDLGRVFNKRIVLQKNDQIPDSHNGFTDNWVDVATVWAEFRKPRTATVETAEAFSGELTYEVVIWKRGDVERGWRVLWKNKVMEVENVYNYDDETIVLVCRELAR